MSYVSGFMMGAAIGKSIRQMLGGRQSGACAPRVSARRAHFSRPVRSKAVPDGLELVSALPGRRRYRAAVISAGLASILEENLSRLDFVRNVEVNALSGSILFCFEEADALKIEGLAAWLRDHIFGHRGSADTEDRLPDESHAGSVTRSIRGSARAFSAWIKHSTGGLFDMSSLASLLFGLRGLRKMIMTQTSPSGAQMLWWALSLMRGWRTV
ncbi:HMA2 domain-containing protein [uncultured Mitsuokella sp.]|uniref:HMA2 domain-containing protein n=1 Tax=uncultured Mitsuokella sp. TaxID=453120 RepID=UPI0026DCD2F3|nr:hypothetical protein [uncultured Mitsuokella sp.]